MDLRSKVAAQQAVCSGSQTNRDAEQSAIGNDGSHDRTRMAIVAAANVGCRVAIPAYDPMTKACPRRGADSAAMGVVVTSRGCMVMPCPTPRSGMSCLSGKWRGQNEGGCQCEHGEQAFHGILEFGVEC